MAIPMEQSQIVYFEELLMSQVVQQEALTRLLLEKGIFTKEVVRWRNTAEVLTVK